MRSFIGDKYTNIFRYRFTATLKKRREKARIHNLLHTKTNSRLGVNTLTVVTNAPSLRSLRRYAPRIRIVAREALGRITAQRRRSPSVINKRKMFPSIQTRSPQVKITITQKAGLLTHLPLRPAFPIRKSVTARAPHGLAHARLKSLQQRELFGIHTRFPFNPFRPSVGKRTLYADKDR